MTPYRREPFRLLAEAEGVEVLAFGPDPGEPVEGLRVRRVSQRGAARLAGSGRYRAVIGSLAGRVALPGGYLGARRARVPFVLWASVWRHPRTLAHGLSLLPTRHLYRHSDAVVTYGPHVSAYVAARRGTRAGVFEAPQAAEPAFAAVVAEEQRVAARAATGTPPDGFLALFVGRLEAEKGVPVLLEAWRRAALGPGARLALAGAGPLAPTLRGPGVHALGRQPAGALPALYAAADVLVLPSLRTATFLEPWGLVVNEAMHQGTPIIASDAVGAVAGGLVKDGRNGLVSPQGDAHELAERLRRLASDPHLRHRLGRAARTDVAFYTPTAWSHGMRRALAHVGAGRDG